MAVSFLDSKGVHDVKVPFLLCDQDYSILICTRELHDSVYSWNDEATRVMTMKRPKFPPHRIIREGCYLFCPKCGSSMTRKYFFFGKKECINEECELNNKGAEIKIIEYIDEKGW